MLPRGLIWDIKTDDNKIYLTFDDGPTPALTPVILQILDTHNIKATFFCVGQNVRKYPELFANILEGGHSTGHHTFNHLNGWKTAYKNYLENVAACSQVAPSNLFRPPYGRLTLRQYFALKKQYRIIMWSVLTRDWDYRITRENCLKIAERGLRPGAIFIFHDNIKAEEKIKKVLPVFINSAQNKGYNFHPITEEILP